MGKPHVIAILVLAAAAAAWGVTKFDLTVDAAPASSSAHTDLAGRWVEPVPGQDRQVQGFALHPDGTASSINMATLTYKRWALVEDALTLTVESCGNRSCAESTETYRIDSHDPSRLQLIGEGGQPRALTRPDGL